MRTLYLDSNILIQLVEGQANQFEGLQAVVDALDSRKVLGVTSELTIAEVMVKPLASPISLYRREYEAILSANSELRVAPVSRPILIRSAELRAELGGKLADGIHVSTAELEGCAQFLTEDRRVKLPSGLTILRLAELPEFSQSIREGL